MTSYSTMALPDLLDAFASNEPVPGGGSAAALAGAVGVSLLVMGAGLPKTRTGAPEEAAYRMGFIDAAQLVRLSALLGKGAYAEYLLRIAQEGSSR